MSKQGFKSRVFNGVDKPVQEELRPGRDRGIECTCIGPSIERVKHTWFDPRCLYYMSSRPNPFSVQSSPQLLPPPREPVPQKITEETSMFKPGNGSDYRADCYCSGPTGKWEQTPHKVGDQGCFLHSNRASGVPRSKLLEKETKTDNPCIGFPIKEKEEIKFDPPVTREMEMLCTAYNKAMKNHPKDFVEMHDGYAMNLKCMRHIVAELHLMGWICQEEYPFGE